jgi:hypothetical protein
MSLRRSSRSSVKKQRSTRAAARKKSVKSRAKRVRNRPANVGTLVSRFSNVRSSRRNPSKGSMRMADLYSALPVPHPFRKGQYVRSKSKSKSKSKSPIRRRSNKSTGARRYSHIMNRRYSGVQKHLPVLKPSTFNF